MGVDSFAILLSVAAAIVLVAVVGRVLKFLLKVALVVAVAWVLYAKVYPALKKASGETRKTVPVTYAL